MNFQTIRERQESARQNRLALLIGAAFTLATLGLVVPLAKAPAVALDAPCGPGIAFVRMYESPGFEGDSRVICGTTASARNFALLGNANRVCDGAETGLNRFTWKNCPSSIYVSSSSKSACFWTWTDYRENRLRIYGPAQVNLVGTLWNNNFESFKWGC